MTQDEGPARAHLGDAYATYAAHARKSGLLRDCPALSLDQAVLLTWRTDDSSRDFRIRAHAGKLSRSERLLSGLLDDAVALLPVSTAPTIDRVVTATDAEMFELRQVYRMGRTVTWDTMRSCSGSSAYRHMGNVRFLISHRSGRVIGPYSRHPEENEVLLPAGCRFLVGPIVEVEAGRFEISLEEIP